VAIEFFCFFVTRGPTNFFLAIMTGSPLSSIGALRFQEPGLAGRDDMLTVLRYDGQPFLFKIFSIGE
jgi:hypothetical protein